MNAPGRRLILAGLAILALATLATVAGRYRSNEANMIANQAVIHMRGLAGIEHVRVDGSFTAGTPETGPMPARAGDRLHLQLDVPGAAWVYAIAAFQQDRYWKIGEWGPGSAVNDAGRVPWPQGYVLTEDDARMTTLFVVASIHELGWAQELTQKDCVALTGKLPPDPPQRLCDHLYGLFWQVPGRVRGRAPHLIRRLESPAIPAVVTENSGSGWTAVEWLFKPR